MMDHVRFAGTHVLHFPLGMAGNLMEVPSRVFSTNGDADMYLDGRGLHSEKG